MVTTVVGLLCNGKKKKKRPVIDPLSCRLAAPPRRLPNPPKQLKLNRSSFYSHATPFTSHTGQHIVIVINSWLIAHSVLLYLVIMSKTDLSGPTDH
jgi:hypothetical protein